MNLCKIVELNSGEFIGVQVIELTRIPDISILKNEYIQGTNIEEEYRNVFGALLTEIHLTYMEFQNRDALTEVSLEFLWITEPVVNQPFKANIRLFLILRSLSHEKDIVVEEINRMVGACSSSLKLHKYSFELRTYESVVQVVSNIPETKLKSVVKDEREENLQNQMLPTCYAFDQLSAYSSD